MIYYIIKYVEVTARRVWDKMIQPGKNVTRGTLLLVIWSSYLKLLRFWTHCNKVGIPSFPSPPLLPKKGHLAEIPLTAGGQKYCVCVNPSYSSMYWEMRGWSIKFFSSGQARTTPLKITYSGVESAIKGETNAQVKPHESGLSVLQGWQKHNCVNQGRCLLSSGLPSS